MGSSPVAFEYFFFRFVFRFASFFVFILDCVHNWIHVFEFGIYVTNTAPCIISISLHVINSLHAEYSLRLLLSYADF